LKILSLTVLLLMTTTARKTDLDQGNWRNFEERANSNFKSSFHETKIILSLDWALNCHKMLFLHKTQLKGNLSDNSLSFYLGCHRDSCWNPHTLLRKRFFLGILYRLKWCIYASFTHIRKDEILVWKLCINLWLKFYELALYLAEGFT